MILSSHGFDPAVRLPKLGNDQGMWLVLCHRCVVVLKPMLESRKAHVNYQVVAEAPSQMIVHPRRSAVPLANEMYRFYLLFSSPLLAFVIQAVRCAVGVASFRQ